MTQATLFWLTFRKHQVWGAFDLGCRIRRVELAEGELAEVVLAEGAGVATDLRYN
jgi:hypothetical protein